MKGNAQNAINSKIYHKELLLIVTDMDKMAPQPLDIFSLLIYTGCINLIFFYNFPDRKKINISMKMQTCIYMIIRNMLKKRK